MDRNPVVRFFSALYHFVRRIIILLGTLVFIAVVFFLWKSGSHSVDNREYSSSEKIFLKMKLEGSLISKAPQSENLSDFIFKMFKHKENEHYIYNLKHFFQRLSKDPQVLGLYVELGELEGAITDFSELRRLLAEVKKSGKKIEVWTSSLENKTYYLGSIADRIDVAPEGQIFIPGPMFQLIYGGEAFRKLGVAFDVIRAGQYKSAFEPLIADQPSFETEKAYMGIEESVRKHLIREIASSRKIDLEKVESWFKQSLFSAKEAFVEKIIDGLSYPEAFEERLSKVGKIVDWEKYADFEKESELSSKEGIALIEVVGEIYMSGAASSIRNSDVDVELLRKELKWAREDDRVKSVVLRVDCPGGSSLAADLIWEDVRRLSDVKPVVVSMGAYAASGGYYLSAPARKIIAEPLTITGSIGVVGLVPNVESFKQKYGVSFYTFSRSDRKNMLNPGSKMTQQDRDLMARHIRATYETFVNKVASARKRSFDEIDALAQGRVWTGEQAKDYGLVDELGGLVEAFHSAKELGKLNIDQKYPILHYEGDEKSLVHCLKSGKLWSCFSLDKMSLLETHLQKLPWGQTLSRILRVSSDENILVLLPASVEIR